MAHLARHVLTPESDAEAMARWLRSLDTHGKVLELGTSLGLTAPSTHGDIEVSSTVEAVVHGGEQT